MSDCFMYDEGTKIMHSSFKVKVHCVFAMHFFLYLPTLKQRHAWNFICMFIYQCFQLVNVFGI